MKKSYMEDIDIEATLEEGVYDGGFFIMDDDMYRDMIHCGKDGPVMQPSLFIDNGDGYFITKFTKQKPLDFYINKDGEVVDIKPAKVSPYLITVFNTETGKKLCSKPKKFQLMYHLILMNYLIGNSGVMSMDLMSLAKGPIRIK
jgi:hypothetical protein